MVLYNLPVLIHQKYYAEEKISICETNFHRYILILHPKKNVLMLYDDG